MPYSLHLKTLFVAKKEFKEKYKEKLRIFTKKLESINLFDLINI